MSGQLIGGVIGAAIGFFTPIGPALGWAVGSAIGGAVAPGSLPDQFGPRLSDLTPQSSEYGRPIPILYGTVGIAGNVIWAMPLIEVATTTEQGGKGSGPSQSGTTYAYYANFAVLFCEGEHDVLRIWAGPEKRLIYENNAVLISDTASIRVYTGSEEQMPDPLIENDKGVGNTPAYRGSTYVVFENYPLRYDGNRLPFIFAEISGGGTSCPTYTQLSSGKYLASTPPVFISANTGNIGAQDFRRTTMDKVTKLIYYVAVAGSGASTNWYLERTSPVTGYVGPPLFLSTGILQPRIAFNNAGRACFIVTARNIITTIDLINWVILSSSASKMDFIEIDDSVTQGVPIPLADVVSTGAGSFGVLSLHNEENSFLTKGGVYPYSIQAVPNTWGSTGERAGGSLLPMAGKGAAASFTTQPSNFAPEAVTWQVYDSRRNILISFFDGVYNKLSGDGFHHIATPPEVLAKAIYDPITDKVYAWGIAGLISYNPAKLTPTSWPREECILFRAAFPQVYSDGGASINWNYTASLFLMPGYPGWIGIISDSGDIFRVKVSSVGEGIVLSEVVADLSYRSGLTADEIDVTPLTDIVDGYVVARRSTTRAAIDALRPVYYFDGVESMGVLKYIKRGGPIMAVIPDGDLAAHTSGEAEIDPLNTRRQMEAELLKNMAVTYLSKATIYDTAVKQANRQIGFSQNEGTVELPMVLTDTKAQEVAEVNLHRSWVQRIMYSFNLPKTYAYLEPTDLVVVKGYVMRLVKITSSPHGFMICEAVQDDVEIYTPNVIVTEVSDMPELPDPGIGETIMVLL